MRPWGRRREAGFQPLPSACKILNIQGCLWHPPIAISGPWWELLSAETRTARGLPRTPAARDSLPCLRGYHAAFPSPLPATLPCPPLSLSAQCWQDISPLN